MPNARKQADHVLWMGMPKFGMPTWMTSVSSFLEDSLVIRFVLLHNFAMLFRVGSITTNNNSDDDGVDWQYLQLGPLLLGKMKEACQSWSWGLHQDLDWQGWQIDVERQHWQW
jgi:hypothetical protein